MKQRFQKDNAAKFNVYVELDFMEVPLARIARYTGISQMTLHRWKRDFSDNIRKKKKDIKKRIEKGETTPEALKEQLQIDCAIRHLLKDKDVRFMHALSLCLSTETQDNEVKEAIETTATIVDLDANVFWKALLQHSQAIKKDDTRNF